MKRISKAQLYWLKNELQAEIDRELENKTTADGQVPDDHFDDAIFNSYAKRFSYERRHWIRILMNSGSTFQAVFNAANRIAFGQNLRDWRNIGLENRLWDESSVWKSNSNARGTIDKMVIYPFKLLPNAKSFEIELGPFHALFALFGIKKRWKPFLKFTKYRNQFFNRYLEHQCIRLEACKRNGNASLYWAISRYCMKKSITFFIEQLNRTVPNWHRTMPLWSVKRLFRQVRALAHADHDWISVAYQRVFIPKSPTKHRPLGVPELRWRIYLGLWNSFTVKFLSHHISENQHAFVPNKGTLTCWRRLLQLYFKWPSIIEFDLKGWFDNVGLDYLASSLRKRGMPEDVIRFLDNVSSKLPHGIHFIDGTTGEDEIADFSEPFSEEALRLDRLKAGKKRSGVAQGMPLSPFLSNIVLEDTIFKLFNTSHSELLMYADDGLVFCEAEKLTEDQRWFLFGWPQEGGVKVNESKTFKVKINDCWYRPLKFLGLELFQNTLRANTRNGSKLIMDKWELVELLEDPEKHELVMTDSWPKWRKGKTIHNIISSTAFGLIQARLYYGKWNLDDLRQDFSYTFVKKSWAFFARNSKKLNYGKTLNVFNSSSIASYHLADILSRVRWDKQVVPGDSVLLPDLSEEENALQIEEAYEETKWDTLVNEIQEEWEYQNLNVLIDGQRKGLSLKEIVNSIPGTVIETQGRTRYGLSFMDRVKAGKCITIGHGTTPTEFKRINARFNERGLTYPLKGPWSHNWFK